MSRLHAYELLFNILFEAASATSHLSDASHHLDVCNITDFLILRRNLYHFIGGDSSEIPIAGISAYLYECTPSRESRKCIILAIGYRQLRFLEPLT